MPRKNKVTKEAIEFKFEGEHGNEFSGRVYEGTDKKNCTQYPLSITINGLALVGAKLMVSEKATFINMPSYKTSAGEYKSLIYFYNKDDIADINACAEYIESLL